MMYLYCIPARKSSFSVILSVPVPYIVTELDRLILSRIPCENVQGTATHNFQLVKFEL